MPAGLVAALRSLEHGNIAKVKQTVVRASSENQYMLLDVNQGVHLLEYMKGAGMPSSHRVNTYRQMAKGISGLHSEGILHCKITPNAFFCNKLNSKVVSLRLLNITTLHTESYILN